MIKRAQYPARGIDNIAKIAYYIREYRRQPRRAQGVVDMTTTGTLRDKVYAAVLARIISGEYTVDSVISEKELSETMQVSKAPVREALISLCSNGILRSVPRIGYVVVRYTHQNLRDILEYREMLECGCLERSFGRISPTQLRRLESVVGSEFLFLSDGAPRDYWDYTHNFHLTLASFAENEYLYRRLDDALNTFMRASLQLCWPQLRDNPAAPSSLHLRVVEAIRDGDRAAALEYLRRDIRTLLDPADGPEDGPATDK